MVGALKWGSSSLGPSPGGGCFVVFLGNELSVTLTVLLFTQILGV